MSPIIHRLAHSLQAIGYYAVLAYPHLVVSSHLLFSALLPIYTGAHASLSRPSSAAKPLKRNKKRDRHDDEREEQGHAMEGLSPIDALLLPLFAAFLLASLYFLIKWLEDPALLNKILNWYLAIAGIWSVARMLADCMGLVTSFVFPETSKMNGDIWEIDASHRKFRLVSAPSVERDSPLPGLSFVPLPRTIKTAMWALRELLYRKLDANIYIRGALRTRFQIGPQGITSLFLALATLLYFNLVSKPWWLTNLLGLSFAYSALQIMSPTTSWTGTLILSALFIYDIYFVFFTPLMVTVATQLDIPAKLLFPRPSRPDEDSKKQAFSMLGLGDIILPGMMIGFALRFDLYLFYLRKQTQRTIKEHKEPKNTENHPQRKKTSDSEITKAVWHPATGGWGERFWTPKHGILKNERFQGVIFPKTYFYATITGYVLAMLCTLVVMDIYGHAQPALLYLVPGILISFWGTALIKGDIKTLWVFDEFEHEEERVSPSKGERQNGVWKSDSWTDIDWKSLFVSPTSLKDSELPKESIKDSDGKSPAAKRYSLRANKSRTGDNAPEEAKTSRTSSLEDTMSHSSDFERPKKRGRKDKADEASRQDRRTEIIFISVTLPETE